MPEQLEFKFGGLSISLRDSSHVMNNIRSIT
jgi:hypothetical protein